MIASRTKDRVARRLGAVGWLVAVLVVAGVAVGVWQVQRAWPHRAIRGTVRETEVVSLSIPIVAADGLWRDGSRRWRVAGEQEIREHEEFGIYVIAQEFGAHVRYARRYLVLPSYRWEAQTTAPPSGDQVIEIGTGALRAWAEGHPGVLPAGLLENRELVVELGPHRRLLEAAATVLRARVGVSGIALAVAGLVLAGLRWGTRKWILRGVACAACGYDLGGLQGRACPECGCRPGGARAVEGA